MNYFKLPLMQTVTSVFVRSRHSATFDIFSLAYVAQRFKTPPFTAILPPPFEENALFFHAPAVLPSSSRARLTL